MKFIRQVLLVMIGVLAFSSLQVNAREVPYFRQNDFVGFGLSACGPSSIAMIIKYYYPFSQISPGKVYHEGSQSFVYDKGPIELYKNRGVADFCYDVRVTYNHPNSPFLKVCKKDNFYPNDYFTGTDVGMLQPTSLKYFFNKYNIEIESIPKNKITKDFLIEKLSKSPGLFHIPKHYLVIYSYNKAEDKFLINNPYALNMDGGSYSNLNGKNVAVSWERLYKKLTREIVFLKKNDSKIPDYSVLVDATDVNLDNYVYNKNFNIAGYKYKVYNHPINNWTYKFNENNQTAWYEIYDPWIDHINGPQKFNEMKVDYTGNMDDIRYYYGGGKSFIYLSKMADTKQTPAFINSVKWKPALYKTSFFNVVYSYYDKGAKATLKFYLKNKDNQVVATKEVKYINDGKSKQVTLWNSVPLGNGDYVEVDNIRSNINLDAVFFKNVPFSISVAPSCYDDLRAHKNISAKCSEWVKKKITPFTLATTLVSHYTLLDKNQNIPKLIKQISDILNRKDIVFTKNQTSSLISTKQQQNFITRAKLAEIFVALFKDKLKYSDTISMFTISQIKNRLNVVFKKMSKKDFVKKFKDYGWVYSWAVEDKWTTPGIVLKLNDVLHGNEKDDMLKDTYVTNSVLSIMLINLEKHINKRTQK